MWPFSQSKNLTSGQIQINAADRQQALYDRLGIEGDISTPVSVVLSALIDRIEKLEGQMMSLDASVEAIEDELDGNPLRARLGF